MAENADNTATELQMGESADSLNIEESNSEQNIHTKNALVSWQGFFELDRSNKLHFLIFKAELSFLWYH